MAGRTWMLEFPYRRSVGGVIGDFLGGLADRRVLGVRTAGGRVLVPPLEYDPETGEPADALVEVGTSGVVEQCAWVSTPLRGHPLESPFAWALVRLDGADTSLLHVIDAPTPESVSVGMRVSIRWRDETEGKITDIECFEAERTA